ncbi:HutD/Ves family protein [Phaeovulum sp. W22_SRMD_FR3]|uniref:HutD/Ves family protein n=1 Tax=Phaeovulum sp. W22_SRMD_FR3 TaxID=3240274 RepID=UPI003F9A65B3
MNIIHLSDLVERPWRNGGGITREICERHHGTELLWRLSMADVAADGPFSDFSGLMRVLTVIDGGAMELITPEGRLMAHPRTPVRFDGGVPVTSKLCDGPLRDLNLMFDPRRIAGEVTLIEGPGRHRLTATDRQSHALHQLSGMADLGANGTLSPGDTLLLEAAASADVALAAGSAAVLIALTRLP